MKKVAIYVRVSTEGQNTDNQLEECKEWVERKGWKYDVYGEKESAKGVNRVELQKMLGRVDKGRYGAIVVWKIDRLSRSMQDFVGIFRRAMDSGCGIVSITQGIDTSGGDANSRMMVNLMMVFAEWERELIVERTKAGLRRAKREGKKLGRKSVQFDVVGTWRKWKKHGFTFRELAEITGVSKSVLQRKLVEFDRYGDEDEKERMEEE